MARVVSDHLRDIGYRLLVSSTDFQVEVELNYLKDFQSGVVDGMILFLANDQDPRTRAALAGLIVPAVLVDRSSSTVIDRVLSERTQSITSLDWTQKLRHEVLAHYRERGKAEGHMGEMKDVLAPALASSNRAKSHWRGKTLKSKIPAMDAFACNEVRLLISGRRMTLALSSAAAPFWSVLLPGIRALHWADP